jgi:hypothetical protein
MRRPASSQQKKGTKYQYGVLFPTPPRLAAGLGPEKGLALRTHTCFGVRERTCFNVRLDSPLIRFPRCARTARTGHSFALGDVNSTIVSRVYHPIVNRLLTGRYSLAKERGSLVLLRTRCTRRVNLRAKPASRPGEPRKSRAPGARSRPRWTGRRPASRAARHATRTAGPQTGPGRPF